MTNQLDGTKTPLISSRLYDFFKLFVQIIMPGLGTLYFALSSIWGLPYGEQIVGTIAALTVFLGLFLKYSDVVYARSDTKYDGVVDLTYTVTDSRGVVPSLSMDALTTEAVEGKDEVLLKVVSH